MAINFPTSLDNFTNPASGNTLNSPSHSLQHSDINDAVEALERKVGVGTAVAGSASAGQVLTISAAGTSTWSTPTAGGLIQIVPSSVSVGSGSGSANANGNVSFSGASSVSLNGCFSATYRNYRIVLDYVPATTSGSVSLRMRASAADNSTANYQRTIIYLGAPSTVLYARSTNATGVDLNGNTANAYYSTVFDLITPFETLSTQASGLNVYKATSSDNEINIFQFGFNGTTSFDGISVLSSGSNLTGSISVYGYR